MPAQRLVLEEAADDVEHLVRTQRLADCVKPFEQHSEHPAFPGACRNQIDDAHIVLLSVAVNAAHPLLQTSRVPGDVVVDHQAAELEVDALARGVGRDKEAGTRRVAEALHLLLALLPRHGAVDRGDLTRVAKRFEPSDQVVDGVAVLTEHQPFLVGMAGVFQNFAEPFELRLLARLNESAGPPAQIVQGLNLVAEFIDGDRDHRAEHGVLVVLVPLEPSVVARVVGSVVLVEVVRLVPGVESRLGAAKSPGVDPPGFEIRDQRTDLLDPPLERLEQSPRRAGQSSLEDTHGELGGLLVAGGQVVGMLQVGRRTIV